MGIAERKEREKEQRRNNIIDAAEKVFFSRGLDAATMDDVAEEAELSKGTLYLYFKSKEELYLAITQRGLRILTEMFEKCLQKKKKGIDMVLAIGRAYREFAKKYPDYFQAAIYFESQIKDFNPEHPNAVACMEQGEKVLNLVVEALKKGVEDGTIRPGVDPLKTAIVLWGQTTGILWLVSSHEEYMKEKLAQFNFKKMGDIIDYSFKLNLYSLKNRDQGDF